MKSHEEDQLDIAKCVYYDAFAQCVAVQPDLRDVMTITSRVKTEGLSFLTITLPAFCKDFERSLAVGEIDSTAFKSFKKVGAIPAFLQGMLSQVFDRGTGRILNEDMVNISCISGVRAITAGFKKLETECAEKRIRASLQSYKQTEYDLCSAVIQTTDDSVFRAVSDHLWDCLRDVNIAELLPKHGPGAVTESLSSNAKYNWRQWHDRLEPYFPVLDTAYPITAYQSREFENVSIICGDDEAPVKVTTVPKTMKGPRIIAIEPCCMQYVQQSIQGVLYNILEKARFTKGHVNFTDQSVNRGLALISSKSGQLATIDLSDASDRVLRELALSMFDCNPDLRDAIDACRSTRAVLPSGEIISPLRKFASMGSALCFPVESMYFYTICVVALLAGRNLPVTSRNVYLVSRDVYVYGDDILVPSSEATIVVEHLQKYYCKVNMSKSFWTGRFRESCGMDAYDGVEVTPTYIRKLRPNNKRQASEIVSWVSTANLFLQRGYYRTAEHMFSVCERILGNLPTVSETSSALGRIQTRTSPRGWRENVTKWNRKLHRSEVRAWVASPVFCTDKLDGYGALMKSLLSLRRTNDPIIDFGIRENNQRKGYKTPPTFMDELNASLGIRTIDSKHLERSARHGAVTLKRQWVLVA